MSAILLRRLRQTLPQDAISRAAPMVARRLRAGFQPAARTLAGTRAFSSEGLPGGTASGSAGSSSATPAMPQQEQSMEDAMSEQRRMLFPTLGQLEAFKTAQATPKEGDSSVDAAAPQRPVLEEDSRRLPYRTYSKADDGTRSDDDSDEDSDEEEASKDGLEAKAGATTPDYGVTMGAFGETADDNDLEVEEFGFTYVGPEPTLYGDWAHKGRVSDF
eukprot:TRINITY_DN25250_c0_g1_i1.p1 TRINITY_DN25250_c0_g1~~TRINITY_DN25250_c0_g1_i1.p1  ORF type:complete len:217 (+),score=48.52 TRINITY_DN25250_c0_g1_i1:84-734(+)